MGADHDLGISECHVLVSGAHDASQAYVGDLHCHAGLDTGDQKIALAGTHLRESRDVLQDGMLLMLMGR